MSGLLKSVLQVTNIVATVVGALADKIPALEKIYEWINDLVDKGEVEADRFVDRNLPVVIETRDAGIQLKNVGQAIETLCDTLIRATQTVTPDRFEAEEMQQALEDADHLRKQLVVLVEGFKDLPGAVAGME